jgi:hypothetical protein
VVNGEEEASPPSYPSGCLPWVRRVCAGQGHPPKLSGPPFRAISHRNVVAGTYKLRHCVRRGAGDFFDKKLPPLPVSGGVRRESLVELPPPGLGGVAELG